MDGGWNKEILLRASIRLHYIGRVMRSFLLLLVARDELPSAGSGPEPFGFELMAERLVEGGRVGGRRSFRDLGMGETAAPPKAENAEGARFPRKQVAEKTSQ